MSDELKAIGSVAATFYVVWIAAPLAVLVTGPWLLSMVPDWDEVMIVAMGFAGLAYIIVDQKRERRLDTMAVDFAGRLAALEANNDDSIALEGRLRALEIQAEKDERLEERIADYAERLATTETKHTELIARFERELEDA